MSCLTNRSWLIGVSECLSSSSEVQGHYFGGHSPASLSGDSGVGLDTDSRRSPSREPECSDSRSSSASPSTDIASLLQCRCRMRPALPARAALCHQRPPEPAHWMGVEAPLGAELGMSDSASEDSRPSASLRGRAESPAELVPPASVDQLRMTTPWAGQQGTCRRRITF